MTTHSPELEQYMLEKYGMSFSLPTIPVLSKLFESREKKKARKRVESHFTADPQDRWRSFDKNVARKSFVRTLGSDSRSDKKLQLHADNMNRLKRGKVISKVRGDLGGRTTRREGRQTYEITKLRGSNRLGCTCNDWRFKKSVAGPGQEQDCRHIKQWKAEQIRLPKAAGHVENRVRERAPGTQSEVNSIRKNLHKMRLAPGKTYHVPLYGGTGHVVVAPAGKGHAVKTVLGPKMRPPGQLRKQAGMSFFKEAKHEAVAGLAALTLGLGGYGVNKYRKKRKWEKKYRGLNEYEAKSTTLPAFVDTPLRPGCGGYFLEVPGLFRFPRTALMTQHS